MSEENVVSQKINVESQEKFIKIHDGDKLDLSKYKPEDIEKSRQIANKLNANDQNAILNFGLELQTKLSSYSSEILNNVRSYDAGEIGTVVNDLLADINYIDIGNSNNPLVRIVNQIPLVRKLVHSTKKMISKYEKVSTNVDNIVLRLDKCRLTLYKDNVALDTMFKNNVEFIHDLNAHILAAELKLEELDQEIIAMETAGNEELSYDLSDKKSFRSRLSKKILDLKLTKAITMQSLPQIRIIQDNNATIVEKIQSSCTNTIPVWQNQIVIALALDKQQKAIEIQKKIYDTTNQILTKNAELLHQNSVDAARQNEEGIVSLETLKATNQKLVDTLSEILKIKEDGEANRKKASAELENIEGELKKKILDVSDKISKEIV